MLNERQDYFGQTVNIAGAGARAFGVTCHACHRTRDRIAEVADILHKASIEPFKKKRRCAASRTRLSSMKSRDDVRRHGRT